LGGGWRGGEGEGEEGGGGRRIGGDGGYGRGGRRIRRAGGGVGDWRVAGGDPELASRLLQERSRCVALWNSRSRVSTSMGRKC
jgi:hypothetical protein